MRMVDNLERWGPVLRACLWGVGGHGQGNTGSAGPLPPPLSLALAPLLSSFLFLYNEDFSLTSRPPRSVLIPWVAGGAGEAPTPRAWWDIFRSAGLHHLSVRAAAFIQGDMNRALFLMALPQPFLQSGVGPDEFPSLGASERAPPTGICDPPSHTNCRWNGRAGKYSRPVKHYLDDKINTSHHPSIWNTLFITNLSTLHRWSVLNMFIYWLMILFRHLSPTPLALP